MLEVRPHIYEVITDPQSLDEAVEYCGLPEICEACFACDVKEAV